MSSNSIDHSSNELNKYIALVKTSLDLDKWSNYIDQNIVAARYVPYFVGAVGTLIIFRSVRFCTKFTNASKVPNSFVKKNMEFRGLLKNVNLDGSLQVAHLPLIRMPWHNENQCLNIKLAYSNPTISGVYWMKLNLVDSRVKFTIFDKDVNNDQLVALVRMKLFKQNLNELLVVKGLATVDPFAKVSNKKQSILLKNLQKNELKAKKDYLGVWEGNRKETFFSQLSDRFRKILAKFSTN